MGKLGFDFKTARGMLEQLREMSYLKPNKDGETPIELHADYARKKSPGAHVVVVVGENASGKSFLRRLMCAVLHDAGHDLIHLSMEGRFDYNGNLGAMRGMLYGDEQHEATGVNSAHLITRGLSNCESRRDTSHGIIWDEPELGLSEGAQMGVGAELAEGLVKTPVPTVAAVLITHSKPLVRRLVEIEPNFVFVGEDPPLTMEGWLKRPAKLRTTADIEAESRRRYRLIQDAMQKRKEAKS